ncbi:trypsin-like peptidase domain-containing protein [Streptomyces sp. DSM 41886]|uniref:Trypsin-like peptidase domain-containing protein n=2 Tax=Streptomyces johnsoniae TaxID=3075532 RepID=A0ABU2S2I0_9ACTN|nr:trypsin-like peptidase domain-containing protein [Streptomyces sp. DSM 41886]MDT0443172.1 trypsin-like peptidase domain-containing protein [Streptomyces sp. DSM 41886]
MDKGNSLPGHQAASQPAWGSGAGDDAESAGQDPYGTPPYGQPGPWAPAPPVQRPDPTPPAGTQLPPPAQGPAPRARSEGPRYDPWATPHGGTPVPQAHPAPQQPPPGGRGRAGRLVAGAAVIALVAGVLGGGIGVYLEREGLFSEVRLPQATAGESPPPEGSIAGIAAEVLPGVVTLGGGTGFVLDDEGHILTNAHVVRPAAESGVIDVTFSSGDRAQAEVIGQDSGYDLAVVKVTGVSGLSPLPLGDSDAVRVGDPVVAIGAPFDLAGTVTSGIISATERPITAGGAEADGSDISYVNALQTDAPINPGNSGGPLVDGSGRVIGVNSAIRTADSGGLDPGQSGSVGLGFAIPVNQAKDVAEQLINTGRASHPVIGVTLDTGYPGDGARIGSASGGRAVEPGSPADEAGVAEGDVITAVDGEPVRGSDELIVKIRSHRPGDELELTIERDGDEISLPVTLGEAYSD